VTNSQLEKDATDTMRFLRTCGSQDGARQADSIQRLLGRFRDYENKLVALHLMAEEVMHQVDHSAVRIEREREHRRSWRG